MKEPETKDVLKELNNVKSTKEGLDYIKDVVKNVPDKTFPDYFNAYLAEHPEKKLPEIIEKSLLSRTYAYEILNGKKKGGRDKIIALCYAAGMTENETTHALTYSGNNGLYAKTNRDAVIILALNMMNQHTPGYDSVMKLNSLLSESGFAELDI